MGSLDRKSREKMIRQNDIMNAAEKIFIRKGYEASTMEEIASLAEYTKMTIYQYFPSKEDIYFALALNSFKKLMTGIENAFQTGESGLEKIRKAGNEYMKFFLDFPDQFLVMSRAREIHNREEESAYHREIVNYQQRMFELFGQAINEGKKDGTIKKDTEENLATLFIVSATVSLFSELAENRERIEISSGIDMKLFLQYSLERLVESLKP